MATISARRFIAAPKEAVWQVISNTDGELNCWRSIRSVDNMVSHGSTVERELSTTFGFKFTEAIGMEPENSITVHILNGAFTGAKTIELKPVDDGNNTIAQICWDIRFNRMMRVFSPLIKKHVMSQTRKALERMALEASQRKQLKHTG